jgi:O-antigen/teichoic acid export membrane protein
MLARNTVWNVVGQVAPVGAALVTVPVLVHGLGPERFGVLTLIWMVVGYFSIFDLGLGRALTQLVSEKLGVGERESVAPLVWTALLLMTALGVAGALVSAALSPLLPGLLKVPPALQRETLHALWALAVSIPLVVSTAGVRGVLEARQRFDLVNIVRLASGVFTYAGPAATLLVSHSLVPITWVLVAGRALTWAWYAVLCLRELPELRSRVAGERAHVGPLLRFGGWMTVSNVVGPLMVDLDRFLIAAVIGAAAVAYYVTPFEAVTRLLLLPWAFAGVLFPMLATAFAQDRAGASRLFARGTRQIYAVLFPFCLAGIAFAHEALALWVGQDMAAHGAPVLRWLAVGVYMNGLVQVPFSTLQAAGRPDLTARVHLAELPVYLGVLWWLTRTWGIEGAAIAWTARAGADAVLLFLLTRKVLPGRLLGGWRRVWPVLAASGAAFAVAGVMHGTAPRAAFVAVVLLAFALLAWERLLGPEERGWLRRLVPRPTS